MEKTKKTAKTTCIAAVGDIHVREGDEGRYKTLFTQISQEADVLVLCGDLTDKGLPSEAEVLSKELQSCTIPVVGVLGNHDYEGGKQEEIAQILKKDHVSILNGESVVINDVGFAGVKGFGGGFDTYLLTPWGESTLKSFVQEAIEESLKLENALHRLETEKKVVVLHFSPIRETVEGEPLEIFPFLGCSRLVSPINRFKAAVAFHGHAHAGNHKGKTHENIPVFNVSYNTMQRINEAKPYLLYEV